MQFWSPYKRRILWKSTRGQQRDSDTQQFLERLGKLNLHSLAKEKKIKKEREREIIELIKVLQATSERGRKSCCSLLELGCMNVISKGADKLKGLRRHFKE